MLRQLLTAAENAVDKAQAKLDKAIERERKLIAEAMGEVCDHGQKHGLPLGGDYWQERWRAECELVAAKEFLDVVQGVWNELPHPPPDLPEKQGYVWQERFEIRNAGEGAKVRYGIGELIPIEQA